MILDHIADPALQMGRVDVVPECPTLVCVVTERGLPWSADEGAMLMIEESVISEERGLIVSALLVLETYVIFSLPSLS